MGRPRVASDEDILRAAFTAITRLGPGRLTLADVAREAGLTPAALVVRFGSKRGLLLAASADAAGGDAFIFPGLRSTHQSPLAALHGLADCLATLFGETPEAVANNLAFAQAELSDTDFHKQALRGSQGMRSGIRDLIREAIAAGELRQCDATRLAGALHATLTGSLIGWATHRQGKLAAWLRRDLQAVLDPYRATPRRKSGRK
jgi:AcrR family transcriptional regulator